MAPNHYCSLQGNWSRARFLTKISLFTQTFTDCVPLAFISLVCSICLHCAGRQSHQVTLYSGRTNQPTNQPTIQPAGKEVTSFKIQPACDLHRADIMQIVVKQGSLLIFYAGSSEK